MFLEKLLLVNAVLGVLVLIFGVVVEMDRRVRAKKAELKREMRRRRRLDEQARKNKEWEEYKARIEALELDKDNNVVVQEVSSSRAPLGERLDNYNCFSHHNNRYDGRSFNDIMSGYTVGEVLDTFYY